MITRSLAQLAGDLRLGDGVADPTGPAAVLLERIAATARVMVVDYAPNAPDAIHDEAFVRLAGWLYDADPSGSTPGGPTALRSSGAASLLGPYRVRRGGQIGKAVDEAVDEAVAAAAPGNPVTDVTVAGSVLTVTYSDGTTDERQLPEGGDGGGVAQAVADAQAAQAVAETARAAAQLAETNAEAAEANAETAKANAETAQAGAVAARTGAESARTGAESARTGAESARTGAESARTGAQAARDGAQTAEGNAQTAQAAAEIARDGAVAAGGTDLFDATAAISTRSSPLTGNIVCPESGTLELLFRQTVGDRKGSVAYAHIPAATIRSMISAIGVAYNNNTSTLVILAHGANRGIGVGVTAANFYFVLNAQSAGTYAITVRHLP